MEIKKFERPAYLAIIILLLFVSFLTTCEYDNFKKQNLNLNNLNSILKVEHLKDSSKIYSMNVQYTEDMSLANRKIMALSLLKMLKPKEAVQIDFKQKIKAEIPISEPVKIDSNLYMKLPQKFNKEDKWYSFYGQLNEQGNLLIDSLTSFGTFTYAFGDTARKGFFNKLLGKKDLVVRLHIDNPNIEVSNLNNIYVKEKKKIYQTTGFKIFAGATIGVILGRQLSK